MSNERIYIVEDERIIALDLQRRLERIGYQICGLAASGPEALAGITDQRPDLVLMDIVLQGSMDGIEVALQIRKELHIPVIFLSAYTDTETIERAKEASPLGYILKPFKERELATILEMALFKSVADNRIREKEQLFSAILNSTTDAILVIGAGNEIVFLNPEAERILETTDQNAKTRTFDELVTLSCMESNETVSLTRPDNESKVFRVKNIRLTNRNKRSFIVDMTVNSEISMPLQNDTILVSFKDISRLYEITDTLKYQSSHDTLTGLLNRNELALRLNNTLQKSPEILETASALFIDIDHFRLINDACGAQAGDQLLKETAEKIRSFMGSADYASRSGGDDFVLVHFSARGTDPMENLATIAQGIIERTRMQPFHWNEKTYPVTLSIGIVRLDRSFKNEHDIMVAGTQTVSHTHESGGNRFEFYSLTKTPASSSFSISEWISKIHNALNTNSFKLYYQPIHALDESHAIKAEILLRMIDSDGAIIQPSDFIPIAERYNLMPAVDRWVIRNSIEAIARIQTTSEPLAQAIFSINLSGASLADESIIGYIMDAADYNGVDPANICIEVTETSAILNLTSASRFIYILKERGFTFALDDFGSGFSSFSYLKNLPVDYLKIDGCFIRNMDRDSVDYTMVEAINSMCQVLGLKTIGEFAENDTIIGMLRKIGVDYAQGYGISKPLPLEADKT